MPAYGQKLSCRAASWPACGNGSLPRRANSSTELLSQSTGPRKQKCAMTGSMFAKASSYNLWASPRPTLTLNEICEVSAESWSQRIFWNPWIFMESTKFVKSWSNVMTVCSRSGLRPPIFLKRSANKDYEVFGYLWPQQDLWSLRICVTSMTLVTSLDICQINETW